MPELLGRATCDEVEECLEVEPNFYDELKKLINKYNKENESGTPDFILAAYLDNCLKIFNDAVGIRDRFYRVTT
jgi:hypothetical protein